MFMFENGLLASFIPEILMVLAYVLCLLTPSVKPQNSNNEPSAIVVQVSSGEHYQVSSFQSTLSDFQSHAAFVAETKPLIPVFNPHVIPIFYKSTFYVPDGLSYVAFSRPPPCFIS